MEAVTIENQNLVTEKFGYWPSFHDAEVDSLHIKRNEPGYWPTISLWVNVAGPSVVAGSETKAKSLWQMELEFTEVIDNEFEGFNHQNVLFDLSFQQDQEEIICLLDTSYGLSGSITARRVAVKSFILVEERA